MAATCGRPVMRSATLSAFSFASAPLLTRNTLAKGSREKRTRRRAARARTRIATALLWNWQTSAWRASAAVQAGCAYPRLATACPPYRSSTRSPRLLVSQTPCADATSRGYCENTGARKSRAPAAAWIPPSVVVRAGCCFGIPVPSGPARRGCRETGGLRQVEHAVHPLHRAAGGPLVEIVDGAQDRHRPARDRPRQVRVVAARHVLDARRLALDPHEGCERVELAQRRQEPRTVERAGELRLHRHVYATRERPGMRHEGKVRLHPAGRARARGHFRHVPVLERAVTVQVRVPQRMVRAFHGFAPRAGAAGDAAHEQRRCHQARGEQRP